MWFGMISRVKVGIQNQYKLGKSQYCLCIRTDYVDFHTYKSICNLLLTPSKHFNPTSFDHTNRSILQII